MRTEFSVAAIPLGGYVKMLDEREGEVPESQLHRAFNRKPVGQRIAVVAAGLLYPFGGPLLSPVLAAGAMALSSVFVLTNALRLKWIRQTTVPAESLELDADFNLKSETAA